MKTVFPALAALAAVLPPPPRHVLSLRAEANPVEIMNQLHGAVTAMRGEIDALAKAKADVVALEKVDRINATVGELQAVIDQVNAKIASIALNAASGKERQVSPEQVAHAKLVDQYMRRGDVPDAVLRESAVKAALTTQSDADGGFLTGFEYDTAVERVLARMSVIYQIAQRRQVGAATFKKPMATGAAASGWVGEEQSRPETGNPRLNEMSWPVMEVYANPYATQAMLDDAFLDVPQWLADEVAIAFEEQMGAAFVTGTGSMRPRGLLSYPVFPHGATPETDTVPWGQIATVNTGAAAAFAASSPFDAIYRLKYALRVPYWQNASWLMNRATARDVRLMKDGSGRYLWEPSHQIGQPALIDGHPVYIDDNMPSQAANAVVMAFGDFQRAYLIVERGGLRVLRDAYSAKPYVQFYTTKRVGGGISNFEAIKFLQCRT